MKKINKFKIFLALLFLSGCTNSNDIIIKYSDASLDSNDNINLNFEANKDFSNRGSNETGSYIYCVLDNALNVKNENFEPDENLNALEGVISRTEHAKFNKQTQMYSYNVILMHTKKPEFSNVKKNINCKVFTAKIFGGLKHSNVIEIPYKILEK